MHILETKPKSGETVLPGADFADAWRTNDISIGESAQSMASRLGGSTPGWIKALLALRNAMMTPFGLKTGTENGGEKNTPTFPVLASRPERVVLGLDDKHLDFRLVIDVEPLGRDKLTATVTTYVKTHGLPGKLYLAVVKPFHRVIVPAMLRRIATMPAG